MPVIFVNGLPKDMTQQALKSLWENMYAAVTDVKELGFNRPEDVTFWFIPDLWDFGLGEEIITILVFGLFDKPERTPEVRARMADNLTSIIREFFPAVKMGECIIYPFNPVWGFSSFEKSVK